MVGAPRSFRERLAGAIDATGSLLCVGLDPPRGGGADVAEEHCRGLLEATLDQVAAVKLNLAFFEQHGSRGYAVAERIRAAVPQDRVLIVDAKRGDVENSAHAYAAAAFEALGADAVTVNPLMGKDSVMPFLQRPGRGVFVLTRTSNPGAEDFLDHRCGEPPSPLYERIAAKALDWDEGRMNLGFVVGATFPAAIAAVRRLAPETPLLLPGVGPQGGSLEEALAEGMDDDGAGCLIAVSRGISEAPQGAAAAARELRLRIDAVRRR